MLEIQNISKTFNAGTVNQKTAYEISSVTGVQTCALPI